MLTKAVPDRGGAHGIARYYQSEVGSACHVQDCLAKAFDQGWKHDSAHVGQLILGIDKMGCQRVLPAIWMAIIHGRGHHGLTE
jgi:hypothetical protein